MPPKKKFRSDAKPWLEQATAVCPLPPVDPTAPSSLLAVATEVAGIVFVDAVTLALAPTVRERVDGVKACWLAASPNGEVLVALGHLPGVSAAYAADDIVVVPDVHVRSAAARRGPFVLALPDLVSTHIAGLAVLHDGVFAVNLTNDNLKDVLFFPPGSVGCGPRQLGATCGRFVRAFDDEVDDQANCAVAAIPFAVELDATGAALCAVAESGLQCVSIVRGKDGQLLRRIRVRDHGRLSRLDVVPLLMAPTCLTAARAPCGAADGVDGPIPCLLASEPLQARCSVVRLADGQVREHVGFRRSVRSRFLL